MVIITPGLTCKFSNSQQTSPGTNALAYIVIMSDAEKRFHNFDAASFLLPALTTTDASVSICSILKNGAMTLSIRTFSIATLSITAYL
jgi:hypothetical protein